MARTRPDRTWRCARRDEGAVAVEFSLVLPLLLLITLGMISTGFVLNRKMSLSQASGEAARYGAILDDEECNPVAVCGGKNWAQLVQAIAVERAGGDAATANVCVALVEGPGTAPVAIAASHTTAGGTNACYVDNSASSSRRVQIRVIRNDQIQLFATAIPLTLSSKATARAQA
ncbi:MAG: TadE/TadG family type IV pilus assembly protein [Acidimicrobiales bacterium]